MKKADWNKADELFRRQVRIILGVTGMTRVELACRLNISEGTLRDRMYHPENLTKGEERKLALIYQQNGMTYDAGVSL